ncbi:MAG TPA: M1 family metallopeptidase [Mycobacterium sp.]
MLRKFALVISTVLTIAMIPEAAHADTGERRPSFSPGAPGIGDPYFPSDGNGGYDVSHYDLALKYQPVANVLTSVATIEARATQNLSQFDLDLKGLNVRSVTVNGDRAGWRRDGTELIITPSRGLPDGRRFTTEIRYDGQPKPDNDDGLGEAGFFPTDDGALVIGQPHVAATWFPANDHPADKASYDIRITVPAGVEAISNGVLLSTRTKGGWSTWTWRAKEPMATYLATATVGQFDITSYRSKGITFLDAIDPAVDELAPDQSPSISAIAKKAFAREPEIIEFLSKSFGRYPFSAAGGIVDNFDGPGFALENQTRPIYDPGFFTRTQARADAVVVHELAHQWYGDSVTIAAWQHIWLNEGFATYAEWLWDEHEGIRTVQQDADGVAAIPADDPFWSLKVAEPGAAGIFDGATYDRAALTLHQLRLKIGDDSFFRLLKTWARTNAGGVVTTDQFIAMAEKTSGQDLGDFFQTWLFTDTKPDIEPAVSAFAARAAEASPAGDLVGGGPRR